MDTIALENEMLYNEKNKQVRRSYMSELQPTELAISLLREGKPLNQVIMEAKLPTLSAYLFDFICKTNKSVEAIADLASLNKASLYRILNGESNPGRNVLIRLSRILNMGLDETQVLLKCGNVALLSGSKPRDIVIIDGILNGKEIDDINDVLAEHGFSSIYSKK